MQEWLTGNCWLFGLAGQNWMLVAAGGLLVYIGALTYVRRRATVDMTRDHQTTAKPSSRQVF
ncbi:MAG: hypothetical protein GC182_13880 [Rhodopseudomonas sp.]|nr:hypothetical protein [Rhodopseudomonas sp.]